VTWTRREVLASLGVGSAHALLVACGGQARAPQRPTAIDPELTTWLRDAVSVLRGAGFATAHALAVSRRRTTAALDVLGSGVARGRADGVVLTVRDKDGLSREQVTNDLSRAGVLEAVHALTGSSSTKAASIDFGPPPRGIESPSPDPMRMSDSDMLARVGALAARDKHQSSRIVYAAALLDIDDAHVWSIAPGRMLEQRLVRVRRSVTRVAWHGSRPLISEASRAWMGGIDAQDLTDDEIIGARENVLVLLTPRAFADGDHTFVLEPAVAANVIDVALRALLTRDAQRVPEVAQRMTTGRTAAAPMLTIVDDPTVSDAYGGFRFDDRGQLASAQMLIDKGQLVGRIERERRPGHVGASETSPSHVRVLAGTADADSLLTDGFVLEEPIATIVDPSSDRIVIQVARAREWLAGRRTGRMFADVEVVADLASLLGAVTEISKETRSIGIRDEVEGQPRWRSVDAPWLRCRALLRQRRRPV
jgi:predicted transcriptional regulator